MSEFSNDQGFEGYFEASPLPDVQKALGSNHDVYTGLDELIDNSIDAGATKIAIVLLLDNWRVREVHVHDNGSGMNTEVLDHILRLGAHNPQKAQNIGRYGVGLKEASLSNSEQTSVITSTTGRAPEGRTMFSGDFRVAIHSEDLADRHWAQRRKAIGGGRGTTVIWHNLMGSYQGDDQNEATRYLDQLATEINKHVALRYHRFLHENPQLISVFTQIERSAQLEPYYDPPKINPFGYSTSGAEGYPLRLTEFGIPDAPGITVHIWNDSKSANFHLGSKERLKHQGFFLYLNNRLITDGGWLSYTSPSSKLRLARVEVTDPRVVNKYFTISPQKGSVRPSSEFHSFIDCLRDTEDPEFTFKDFLVEAEEAMQEYNRRDSKMKPIVPPGKGLAPAVIDAVEELASFVLKDPIQIKWRSILRNGKYIDIDISAQSIYLSDNLRPALTRKGDGIDDAPLVRTLLYLVYNEFFDMGRKTKQAMQKLEFLESVLNTAAAEEIRAYEKSLAPPKRKSFGAPNDYNNLNLGLHLRTSSLANGEDDESE